MTSTAIALGEEEKLGQFLRRERTKKGIFLSEVAEKTCVRTYYLESIEEGEFHKLPPSLIGRGFVRAYASYIDVDADVAAQEFDSETKNIIEAAGEESSGEEESSKAFNMSQAVGRVIHRLEGAFFWLIPRRKKRPAVDLCDFMDQIEGVTNKVRTPR